jgi:hypothetical protein
MNSEYYAARCKARRNIEHIEISIVHTDDLYKDELETELLYLLGYE